MHAISMYSYLSLGIQVDLENRMKTLKEIIVKSSVAGGAASSGEPTGKAKV